MPQNDWARLPQNQSKLPSERMINGDESYFSKLHNESMSSMDKSIFMRHGDIDDVDFKIRLDFLRDFKNKLQLLSEEDEILFRE